MKYIDVSPILTVIKKAVCHVLPVQEGEVTVLGQGVEFWQVEVARLPKVIVLVTSRRFNLEGVLSILVASTPESTGDNNLMDTTQYEVSRLNTPKPLVRVVE